MQNLERGRGLFCRSLMKSQMASPTFTPVFAALVSVVNTKFPEIGELLMQRLILQVTFPSDAVGQIDTVIPCMLTSSPAAKSPSWHCCWCCQCLPLITV